MKTLTDSEFAVVLDSLAHTRDWIKAQAPIDQMGTPNIDSALEKLTEGIKPSTNGIRFELIDGSS